MPKALKIQVLERVRIILSCLTIELKGLSESGSPFIEKLLLIVFALLICNTARCLARRLTGGLALAASAILNGFRNILCFDCLNSVHWCILRKNLYFVVLLYHNGILMSIDLKKFSHSAMKKLLCLILRLGRYVNSELTEGIRIDLRKNYSRMKLCIFKLWQRFHRKF